MSSANAALTGATPMCSLFTGRGAQSACFVVYAQKLRPVPGHGVWCAAVARMRRFYSTRACIFDTDWGSAIRVAHL